VSVGLLVECNQMMSHFESKLVLEWLQNIGLYCYGQAKLQMNLEACYSKSFLVFFGSS